MIDLSNYCPKTKWQIGGTCYAYAVAYTAYSSQYNIANGIKDVNVIEDDAFSTFFVASVVRREYLSLRDRLFDFKCSWLGTADHSLNVLKDYGCTKISEKDFACQDGIAAADLTIAENHKITNFKTVTSDFQSSDITIASIVSELENNNPVITAIYSTDEFHDNDQAELSLTDLNVDNIASNHVVCILGYDDTKFQKTGGFLIKNNYPDWGNNGFAWVKSSDFMHLIEESYTIQL